MRGAEKGGPALPGRAAATVPERARGRALSPGPSRGRQGFTVLFTGLSGAGKSTLATALAALLRETGERPVALLDGDAARRRFSGDLGFSREDRETHLRRVGCVAAGVTRRGGIAICALIAPYAAARRELRERIEAVGGFVEVHVSTPLGTCEARDPKGLYARARAGLVKGLTGIDDPYEAPRSPDIAVDTSGLQPEVAARGVLAELERLGLIR